MARYDEDIVDHAGREFCFIGNLRIILVEILGQFDSRLLDELHITHSTHDNTHGHGIVGLDLLFVERGR